MINTDYNRLFFQLKKTLTCLESTSNVLLGKHDISMVHLQILIYIFNHPFCTQRDISSGVSKDNATITRILDTLEQKGYTKRYKVEGNRRAYHIDLTNMGEMLIEETEQLFSVHVDNVKSSLKHKYETTIETLQFIDEYCSSLTRKDK